ncbi:Putative lipoyltransferase 2, mitochondrial [Cytospora mali]|uniref:Lipoyltransferase 2, mitochondrial n=1 Tax=Cytospora mali TaxID=578113 RepID=A0A194UWK2_CYTMA|nr:Putative lipoyltransferase 2, mitochondrial [Valsa mali var. pyri (nom. inval.)]
MSALRLRHIHLASSPAEGIYPSYKTAAAVQELLRRRMLDFKDAESSSSSARPSRPPNPTLISFTPQPTYTLGRRQAHPSASSPSPSSSSLSPAEISRLKAPLHIRSSLRDSQPTLGLAPSRDGANNTAEAPHSEHIFHPSILTSPRGGLATYHGPGQVVLWPVMVIKSPAPLGYKQFTVRCYSRLLENTTTGLLQRLFGIKGFTTEDPGVWVRTPGRGSQGGREGQGEGGGEGELRKISALGIHLRRHVSSLGAAINLDMPTTSASAPRGVMKCPSGEEEEVNAWARFIACGLEGKGVTCVQEELRAAGGAGIPGLDSEIVARAWAEELAKMMEMDQHSVELVGRDEVEELVGMAEREGYLEAVGRDEL